jgi:Zn-dependent protease
MTDPAAPAGTVPDTITPRAGRARTTWLAALGLAGLKLVKSAKFIKFGLFVASLGALALNRPLEAALVILYAIFVHESGHVLAMKASGMQTKGMYFLPFLGAVAVGREPARTRAQEWFIAIAGPAFGLLSLVPLLAMAYVTGDPQWDAYAAIAALINLFNLLPIGILDGGRIVQAIAFSIAGWLGIAAFAAGLALGAYELMHLAGGVLSLLLVLSLLEFPLAWRRDRDNPIPRMGWPGVVGAAAAYLALLGIFAIAQDILAAAARHFPA